MSESLVEDTIKQAQSKDNLRTYSWADSAGQITPNFSFTRVLEMVDDDPVARGALIHFVDKCIESGYTVIDRKTKKRVQEAKDYFETSFNFRTNILRKIFLFGKLYNNVFLEIVKDTDGKTKELNILDSVNIKPFVKSNGDPDYYESKIPNPKTGVVPTWTDKEIVWFKFNDRGTGFAPVDLKSLWETLLIKSYVKMFVMWLWKTGQYKLLFNFKNASDTDIENFLVYTRKVNSDFTKPYILKGETETKLVRDMREQESLINFLSYLDNQILIALRVPPIDAGIPDASGRSNADAQNNSMTSHVNSFKTVVEDTINNILFPRMKRGKSKFIFYYNDRFEEKQLIENLNILKNIGMTEDAIKEYLFRKRMIFDTETLFEKEVDIQKDKDLMPSRFSRTGEHQTSHGSGEQSTTRQDQLTKQAESSEYWTYNAL